MIWLRTCAARSAPWEPWRPALNRRTGTAPGLPHSARRNRHSNGTTLRRSRRRRGNEDRRRSLAHHLGDRSAVVKRWYARAYIRDSRKLDFGEADAFFFSHVEQNVSP